MSIGLVGEAPPVEPALHSRASAALRAPTSRGELRAFVALWAVTLRTRFAYRMGSLTSLLAALLGQSVFFWVWLAVYREKPAAAPLGRDALFSYLIVALVINGMFSPSVEYRFAQRLRHGLIAIDLIRPLGVLPLQLAQAAGDAVANLALALPIYALGLAFVGSAAWPASGSSALLGALSLGLAFLINFGLSFLLIELALVIHSAYGTVMARLALHQAFSGLAAPLICFPVLLRDVAAWLPFRDIIATPSEIWLGLQPAASVAEALLRQAGWASALLLLGRGALPWALGRHQLQGG